MRLTLYTDYSLRVLIYLALQPDKLVTISELADFYRISRNHLVKVVHELGLSGYIHTTRGKHGGMRLARPAEQIVVGEVVRRTEPDFDLLECLNPETDHCVITNVCKLKSVLTTARDTFLGELDRYTLADLTKFSGRSPDFKSIPVLHG
ncbi:MAG TPA: Rrf2 family transcriptional regulator [Gallionellaceae bacterium]|nr:Rrf2 family transcriptional regulator [Gallionellaceae bacterium]